MKQQNYSNHRTFYPLHHYIFYPLAALLLIWAVRESFHHREQHFLWVAIAVLALLLILLGLMLRQHYALKLQDRLLRMEVRFRYYVLTKEDILPYESKLSLAQLIAIRFASDEEFVSLVKRAADESLSPKQIKKSVRNWMPDYYRV